MKTLREFMKEHGVNDLEDHKKAYSFMVNTIGLQKVAKYLPYQKDELKEAYKKDIHFNNLDISQWDRAAGFNVWINKRLGTQEVDLVGSPLIDDLYQLGITAISCSEGVCILKEAARMLIEEEEIS